ncbi:glycosyltransferase, partial [candidate division KSB3 bacterium]|nr:glycosyltransferase [candidate division KSB3 bacterium]MBD3324184.1 glycosyltransferase [candidate division KSB3 bacterium]
AHELHGKPDGSGLRPVVYRAVMGWMLRQVDGMIVITHGLKRLYAGMGLDERKILVAPDGIESKRLHGVPDKFAARQHLQLPLEKKILCYTGHLFPWKGVYTLAASAQYLPDDVMIYLVGGMEDEVRAMRQFIDWQQLSQVIATGYVPYADVPRYLGAADVLVLPNTAKASISREYTSPLKLFEYMAARRPIVASDLPSLREILTHQATAYLVPPDNPEALAKGIIAVLEDETLRAQMVRTAYAAVQEYTWERRGRNILEFLHLLPQQSVSREERTSDEGNESAGFR